QRCRREVRGRLASLPPWGVRGALAAPPPRSSGFAVALEVELDERRAHGQDAGRFLVAQAASHLLEIRIAQLRAFLRHVRDDNVVRVRGLLNSLHQVPLSHRILLHEIVYFACAHSLTAGANATTRGKALASAGKEL